MDVTAVAGVAVASVSWSPPRDSGDLAITHYWVRSEPTGGFCLVPASTVSCEVTGLAAGTAYRFTVRALSGAGWSTDSKPSNRVVPLASRTSITIEAEFRAGRLAVTGAVEGPARTLKAVWKVAGGHRWVTGKTPIRVRPDGTFTWQRGISGGRDLQVYVTDGTSRSNVVRVVRPGR